jgi:IG-like fold at C-terminal of FixG, putative oxidoreductase
MVKITNNEEAAGRVAYRVTVDGLEGAEVVIPEVILAPEESSTVPLVVRLPNAGSLRRTIPFTVKVDSPTAELLLPMTFKTGASVGGEE